MKRRPAASVVLALILTLAGFSIAHAQPGVRVAVRGPGSVISISSFYDELSPYGEWFQDPTYGWCWTPYDLSENWRPYSDGHWEYTDYGWSWASNEDWGWAPFHYGRWFFDGSYGWAWVPGSEWAPAWVAWRYDDEWVGWAPLPPDARWNASAGLQFADPGAIPSHEWCFVPRRHVLDPSLRLQVSLVARNVTLLAHSHDATRFELRNGRPANIGMDVAKVEVSLGRRVPRERILDVDSPGRGGGRPAAAGAVGFYRPVVRPMPVGRAPAPAIGQRRAAVPEAAMKAQRDQNQRKLESDLAAEKARLASEQQKELRARHSGAAAAALRRQQAAEQQAFEAHAARQRQVLAQRMQKQVVRAPVERAPGKPADKGNGRGRGKHTP